MYGSSATWNAVTFSSFTPRERAGVNAIAALAWNAGAGVGAVISGAIRGAVGPGGYTANLLTLVVFYATAAALILVFFREHIPSGDVGAVPVPAPDSRA
jgi:predicted MFS family arabinose efflux permease